MDLYHHAQMLLYDGKIFQAPLKADIKNALDVGTGTGLWAVDFGEQFPDCKVVGTEISPMQPSWVPPNVHWEIDNAEDEWTWPDNHFDYIHVRTLVGSIKDWDRFYRQAFRCLKPGGYLEHHENSVRWMCDRDTIKEDSPLDQWHKVFWAAGEKTGQTFRIIEDNTQKQGMERAGFVDLTVKDWKGPNTPWPDADERMQRIGAYAQMTLETDAEGWVLYIWNAVMGWSVEEVRVYLAHVRNQYRSSKIRPYQKHRMVYGMKPL